ncbi:MAG: hypothetical protein Q8L88_15420 [Bacteroidota bacterium]|nr:hypothetical protein [Bacteroidota bacterium]
MNYSLNIDNKGEYLHVIARGENTLANILSYFEEVYEACILNHCFNVLIEHHLNGKSIDTFDIFVVITKNYARAKTIGLRIAFISLNSERDTQGLKFGENLAHIRGMNVRLFHTYNKEEMVVWLLGKDERTG